MSWQSVYDFFKNITTPRWLKVILQEIQSILVQISLQVGKEYLDQLKNKIIEVAENQGLSNRDKFLIVFKFGKSLLPEIKDSSLNLLIELIVSKLRASKTI